MPEDKLFQLAYLLVEWRIGNSGIAGSSSSEGLFTVRLEIDSL